MCDTTTTKTKCDGKITDFTTPDNADRTRFNICSGCDDVATSSTNDYGLNVWLYDDPVFD